VNMNYITETQNDCYSCHKIFLFNNKLHKHVHNRCNDRKLIKQKLNKTIQKLKLIKLSESTLIRFIASSSSYVSISYDFQNWRYITVLAKLIFTAKEELICLNIDCIISLIDRSFLKKQILDILIKWISLLIVIWELRTEIHHCNKYIILIIYLPDNNDWLAVIIKEMYIVNNLKIKMLININILVLKNISIMLLSRKAIVSSCDNIELSLTVITWSINSVWKTIMTYKNMIIQLRSHINVLIVKTALSQNCDLLFKSDCHTENTAIYVYIIDYTLSAV